MQAVYHVRNRDLTWRERAAFLRHLPDESAVRAVVRNGPYWTVEAHVLDDVRMELMLLRGVDPKQVKPHPQRPFAAPKPDPEREKKRAAARARAKERRRAIAAGEIT